MPSSPTTSPPRNRPRPKETRVYYRGRSVVITDHVFETWHPYLQRFSIAELDDVHVARGGPDQIALGATVVAVTTLVVGAATWPFLHSPTAWLIASGLMVAFSVVSVACWALNPPEQELRANYRGHPVQLFRSRDSQTFGQVKRALARALEARRN